MIFLKFGTELLSLILFLGALDWMAHIIFLSFLYIK